MLLQILSLVGICISAMAGAMAAGHKKMDLFGVLLIACTAALGGGTIRDVLFNNYPLVWVAHPEYLLYSSICALMTIFIAPFITRFFTVFLILDAAGLAAFVVAGTLRILDLGFHPSIAILGGLITGISGGMVRDVLCNDIPLVLQRELYAVIALAGALLFVILMHYQVSENLSVTLSLLAIFISRLFAIFFHIEIPKFDYPHRDK